MQIFTTYCSSPIGTIRIRCTTDHVSSIKFVEEAGEETDNHPLLTICNEQLQAYFKGERKLFDFPIRQPGTSFQQNVWAHLSEIPFGKTMSYLQLSRQIGDVKAIRAIAAANGKNNLAIIVPCHRVIGSDSKLVGYAGGLWRKKWLLDLEAQFHFGVQQLSLM